MVVLPFFNLCNYLLQKKKKSGKEICQNDLWVIIRFSSFKAQDQKFSSYKKRGGKNRKHAIFKIPPYTFFFPNNIILTQNKTQSLKPTLKIKTKTHETNKSKSKRMASEGATIIITLVSGRLIVLLGATTIGSYGVLMLGR